MVWGRLWANADTHVENLIESISATLMAVWRFVKHTIFRRLMIGIAARCIVAGLLTGLGDCTAWIQKESGGRLFYLKGFQRLGKEGASGSVRVVACLEAMV